MLTITEALAEIKTIGKRLEKKRGAILGYLARDSRLKDPLESDGGSAEYVKRERQGIEDLEKRVVAIRTAIQRSNLTTTAAVGEVTMSVSDWLTFRREVAPDRQAFLNTLNQSLKQMRDKVQREGGVIRAANVAAQAIVESDKKPIEVIVNLEEKTLLEDQESLEKILGDLDGKLSLLNATTTIDV